MPTRQRATLLLKHNRRQNRSTIYGLLKTYIEFHNKMKRRSSVVTRGVVAGQILSPMHNALSYAIELNSIVLFDYHKMGNYYLGIVTTVDSSGGYEIEILGPGIREYGVKVEDIIHIQQGHPIMFRPEDYAVVIEGRLKKANYVPNEKVYIF